MSDITAETSSTVVEDFPSAETPPSSMGESTSSLDAQNNSIEDGDTSSEQRSKVSFPRLGGSSSPVAASSGWGSSLKSSKNRAASPGVAMRSSSVQEAFSLDLEAQYDITKAEFSTIVQNVKQKFGVSVESTLSKTSRTFLISGPREKIGEARRELVKKLTKPVTLEFAIPSKTRSAIIGSNGKTIKAISASNGVKINIAKEVNEDSYDGDLEDFTVTVSLSGDAESVRLAKSKIMEIVKEETKYAKIVVSLDEKLLPFIQVDEVEIPADVKTQLFDKSKEIVFSGPRDEVKFAKVKFINYLNELGLRIVVKKEKVPPKFHCLIDPNELKEKFQVIIQFPVNGEDPFVFTGLSDKVEEAIVHAKNSSKTYNVESLEISKAHGKNLEHAKNLVFFFNKYGTLDDVASKYPNVRIILPKVQSLNNSDVVNITLITKNDFVDEIKSARKEIVNLVNQLTPEQTLVISDIDYQLFHKDIKNILLSTEEDVRFVQLGDYNPGSDAIVLLAQVSDDEFKPLDEELKAQLTSVSEQLNSLRNKQKALAHKELALPKSQQDMLFGESDVSLKLINDEVSRLGAHAQIKLGFPSEDQITVRGDENGVKTAVNALESIIKSPSGNARLVFTVPTSVVSRLIGPKGSTLQQLRNQFAIQIQIPQDASEENTEVTIIGLEYNLNQAKSYISAEVKKWADIITKELLVPTRFHGSLIGPQGAYRIRLEKKYSVYIKFPKEGETVIIRGPSRGVKGAYEELRALLDFEIENGHKEVIQVPVGFVNRVIGKSGERINDIKAEFGVELNFLDRSDSEKAAKTGFVELEIVGSRSNIKEATKEVNTIIHEASDFITQSLENINPKWFSEIIGIGGSQLKEVISKAGGDGIKGKRVDVPNAKSEKSAITIEGPKDFVSKVKNQIEQLVTELENSVQKELDIPSEKYGALIGPGGSVRRELESKFKVRISVPNKNDTSGKVTISGLAANIEACEAAIKSDIIKNNYDLEILIPSQFHSYVSENGLFIQRLRSEFSTDVAHGNFSGLANKISRQQFKVPEDVAGSSEEKVKVTIKELSEQSAKAENIPWRLTYSPIDLSDILGDEAKSTESDKATALQKVSDLINQRLADAKEVNSEGFVWTQNPSKFRTVVGPNGSSLKEIRNQAKVVVQVPRKTDHINNVIYVKGSKAGVEKACDLITKKLLG